MKTDSVVYKNAYSSMFDLVTSLLPSSEMSLDAGKLYQAQTF